MLIGLGEQEQARMLEDVEAVFQSTRDKTYEDSETCHVSKVFRDSGIGGLLESLLQSKKTNFCILA